MRPALAIAIALAGCRPAPAAPAPAATSAPTPEPAPAPVDPDHPQHPVPPFPYRSEDVTYRNPKSGLTLAGTLTLPEATNVRHPAAILVSGSGPQDRDGTVFGHKPLWVLADRLTREGIAVLRVDDRGVGGSERGDIDPTSADFATDVAAGIAFLRTRADIDPKRIAVVGHSEGGMIAPMVAAEDPSIAAIVLLAGPGLPGRDVLVAQAKALLVARGLPEETAAKATEQQGKILTAIAEAPDIESARSSVLAIVGIDNEATRAAVEQQVIPWMVYFLRHDPRPVLARVRCPVLALGGSLDLQVLARDNLPAIEAALREGGNDDVTTRELPGLNHLFQPAQTGDVAEYERSKITFDESALDEIAGWLRARLDVR